MSAGDYGPCVTCGADLSPDNASRLRSGTVIHIGCPARIDYLAKPSITARPETEAKLIESPKPKEPVSVPHSAPSPRDGKLTFRPNGQRPVLTLSIGAKKIREASNGPDPNEIVEPPALPDLLAKAKPRPLVDPLRCREVLPDEVNEDPEDPEDLPPAEKEALGIKLLEIDEETLATAIEIRDEQKAESELNDSRAKEQKKLIEQLREGAPPIEPGELVHIFETGTYPERIQRSRCGAVSAHPNDILKRGAIYMAGHRSCCPACAMAPKSNSARLFAARFAPTGRRTA